MSVKVTASKSKKGSKPVEAGQSKIKIHGVDVTDAVLDVHGLLTMNSEANGGKGRSFTSKQGKETFTKGTLKRSVNALLRSCHNLPGAKWNQNEKCYEGEEGKVYAQNVTSLMEEKGIMVETPNHYSFVLPQDVKAAKPAFSDEDAEAVKAHRAESAKALVKLF